MKIERSRITITCRTGGVAVLLRLPARSDAPARFAVCAEVRITRSGHSMRLVQSDGRHELASPNTALVRLVAQGHRYWREIRAGTINVDQIARREGLTPSYVSRIVRLAFLSPTVVEAILAGMQRAGVDTKAITAPGAYAASWREQAIALLPRPAS